MITYIYYLVLFTGIVYALFIFYFYLGFRKLHPVDLMKTDELPPISVLVAARNEEEHIESTVRSLANQNYPKDLYKIVVVNDRSEDRTGDILERLQQEIENLEIVTVESIQDGISPKKYALLQGVAEIETPFVAATDADCVHPADWLRTYASILTPDLGVATALTSNEKKKYDSWFESVWQKMQYIEHNALAFVSAGTISRGMGFTANGNNMLFNRELYEKSGAEAMKIHLTSGDDFFLIQTAEKRNFSLKFVVNKSSVVRTVPQPTIPKLLNQRARWASKAGDSAPVVLFFSVNTFLFYLGIFIAPMLAVLDGFSVVDFLILAAIKVIPDTIYTVSGHKKIDLSFYPLHYVLMQILHIPFILFVTVKGIFGGFTWKGTKYRQ